MHVATIYFEKPDHIPEADLQAKITLALENWLNITDVDIDEVPEEAEKCLNDSLRDDGRSFGQGESYAERNA